MENARLAAHPEPLDQAQPKPLPADALPLAFTDQSIWHSTEKCVTLHFAIMGY